MGFDPAAICPLPQFQAQLSSTAFHFRLDCRSPRSISGSFSPLRFVSVAVIFRGD